MHPIEALSIWMNKKICILLERVRVRERIGNRAHHPKPQNRCAIDVMLRCVLCTNQTQGTGSRTVPNSRSYHCPNKHIHTFAPHDVYLLHRHTHKHTESWIHLPPSPLWGCLATADCGCSLDSGLAIWDGRGKHLIREYPFQRHTHNV